MSFDSDDEGSYGDFDTPDDSEEETGSEHSFDYGFGDVVRTHSEELVQQTAYTVLTEEDIKTRQAAAVEGITSVFAVSESVAYALLRHFMWSSCRLNDHWFQDQPAICAAVGIPFEEDDTTRPEADAQLKCNICFDDLPRNSMRTTSFCQHFFCTTCWTGYVHAGIQDGPGCLNLRCPFPDCKMMVGDSIISEMASKDEKDKYARFKMRSYVEDNKRLKWCPAAGCSYAVEVNGSETSTGPQDVGCKCGNSFCWECREEAHRPVPCETVNKWVMKNSAESENMNWILANSKPCPQCKRPIEKNQGCMHMTCTPPCKYEFCWLCLGKWSDHGETTGGFYACNRYEEKRQKGELDESERRRNMAKESLTRYTHYYERWAAHEKARKKAQEDLQAMMDDKLKRLSDCQSTPQSQLKFVTDAWAQIVECRRVLKWTYAYGYYAEIDPQKRNFFEFMQGDAEVSLERLHEVAETDLAPFLTQDPGQIAGSPHNLTVGSGGSFEDQLSQLNPTLSPSGMSTLTGTSASFDEFRSKLTGLTAITKNFFVTLVQNLEKGLEEVEGEERADEPDNDKSLPDDKKGKGKEKIRLWGGSSSSSS